MGTPLGSSPISAVGCAPMGLGSGMMILAAISRDSSTSQVAEEVARQSQQPGVGDWIKSNLFLFTGLITALSSAIIGAVWGAVNLRKQKKSDVEGERNRFQQYSEYLVKISDFIKTKYDMNSAFLHQKYPDSNACCDFDSNPTMLWNRNASHDDFMYHRVGLGSLPFQADIQIPKEKFNLIDDSLNSKPGFIKETYKDLHNVPVGIDLQEQHLIGVVGEKSVDEGAIAVVRSLVMQLAANNCYTDVKLGFICDKVTDGRSQFWDFAKWLPHTWSEDSKTRFIATDRNEMVDVFYEITKTLRMRAENEESSLNRKKKAYKPHYVLVIENQEFLEGELIAKYIFDNEKNYGLTVLLLAESVEELPNTCTYIVENTNEVSAIYDLTNPAAKQTIVFDNVGTEKCERFARAISGIEVREIETGGEIPNSLDFFEMHGAKCFEDFNVLDNWKKNRTYETMKALIGKKVGGVDCYLDVHEKYHGPHGLIAGTTGSGKSETLQTYMLSLALNFSPDDVGFFIIDYKGGGMANLFNKLPHLVGQISNLSGNQIRRAMVSIKSENRRRQRIFTENGVNNINLYTQLYKNKEATVPLPHLFIIIDEFAELKREEPEFMRELISVAQVGRSLGVHLILATQKPAGTVDDNIWSNSKFKLCLRVQDRQDSNDMLHKPDAAYITQAGRCYLQVGNDEIFELFQSGYSGATYDEVAIASDNVYANMITNSGKAAIIGNRIKQKQKQAKMTKWMSSITACFTNSCAVAQIDLNTCINDDTLFTEMIQKSMDLMYENNIDFSGSKSDINKFKEFLRFFIPTFNLNNNLNAEMEIALQKASASGVRIPNIKDKTQLDAVIEYIETVAKENGYQKGVQLWLPVLPTKFYLSDLEGYTATAFDGTKWFNSGTRAWDLDTKIGLVDDPVNQSQIPLVIDIKEGGHHAIVGSVVTGKSTFMQSMLYSFFEKYDPGYINAYILDFSNRMLSCFERAPHVGGIMYENDIEKIKKFFNMIETIIESRKKLFNGGNYEQYVIANGVKVPTIMIVIDNYDNFKEKTGGDFEDLINKLSRDGATYGIVLMMSTTGFSMSGISTRVSDNIKSVICMEMGERYKYADVLRTMSIPVLPEQGVKGRGLASVGGDILEFQTALALEAEDGYARSSAIEQRCKQYREVWKGAVAAPIPEIPDEPQWSDLTAVPSYQTCIEDDRSLPFAYKEDDASVYSVDLSQTYCYLMTGKAKTGKTNALKAFINAAHDKNAEIYIIDTDTNELQSLANSIGAEYYASATEIFNFFSSITPDFKQRNAFKRELVAKGEAEEVIFKAVDEKFTKKMIFISDFSDFLEKVYNPGEGIASMNGFLENILEKGTLHNFYFFTTMRNDDAGKHYGRKVYSIFTDYQAGVHFGGNVLAQNIFNFTALPFSEQSKVLKAGIGYIVAKEDEPIDKVVVPFVGRN